MKSLAIIGLVFGTVLGCASTSGGREPATGAASAPAEEHAHEDGDQAGMMAGMCPMHVPGTTVAATEVDGGIGLSFTTTTGDVAELRERARRMAEMHNQPGGHWMMGSHGAAAPAPSAEPQHGAIGHEGGGRGGMLRDSGMMMPAATASAQDSEGGARIILQPKDPAQLGALREHVRMMAQRMAAGECPMMSLGNAGEPAHADTGEADQEAHHPGK